ncbi:hypothetical protein COY52_11000 [Candidatus Desantisbacteria bacterium CG_4_10_14_0_8_um_filter_48_22]|uniref:Uncharacterized protein n=1 Tax=Candidatus Desantisbacteria bacterium CG_4_10_14_0_8_um_filter_48_22 TaxID=1974543 RepID=A0A2M7S5W5_9BACT|nr:MAG: hypothetical protein COS16_01355 [Candidatus Desantisbacteria bacterium CG02_land_8_20_14_3_00_49_13]PIZ14788.1 MAG: hypothetical protein COY52_11000 [Candidatus Desantisbacteria bacterium CG_4_10_14_0_8_um_filter_48_22]
MDVKNFINTCVDGGYEWYRGEHDGEDGYFVGSKRLNTAAHFTIGAIEKYDWPVLEREIKQGKDVYHVTRIVGYYSKIENWNKSKRGELNDRHKGNYQVGLKTK